MSVRLFAENYRVLRKIDWELPKGVCALVGPNGSGKTTLLELLELFQDMFANGVWKGIAAHGTMEGFRNLHAEQTAAVKLGLSLGSVEWSLELLLEEATGHRSYSELVRDEESVVVDQKRAHSNGNSDMNFRAFAYGKYGTGPSKMKLVAPIALLADYRLYRSYDIVGIRADGSKAAVANVLAPTGKNIFSVLRNWRDRRATKERYDFVMEGLKDAFPDIFDEMELDSTETAVTSRVFAPNGRESLPILYAPSGLLTGLLHLAAVASTEPGGIVAIDEPENGLHPHATQRLVEAMRDWAERHDLTVLLATHSTVLLDQFKEEPERLFVMEPGREVLPVRVDQVRNREWLARFSLGDLYKAGDFGAPLEGAA